METADEPLTVDPETADEPAGMRDDAILELAIQFASNGAYPAGLAKAKKRAVRKRAANLILENGEVFLQQWISSEAVSPSTQQHRGIPRKAYCQLISERSTQRLTAI